MSQFCDVEHLCTNEKIALRAEIERLRAALKPFALNPGAVSLSKALGHIGREDLLRARAAYQQLGEKK